MTINLIKPKIIVTLGRIALWSLNQIQNHSFTIKEHVGKVWEWNGYSLLPLYHPGPRALIHRPISIQANDYKVLHKFLQKSTKLAVSISQVNSNNEAIIIDPLKQVLLYFIDKLQSISFFKATKLIYLADNKAIEQFGYSITGSIYLREAEGPWIPRLKDVANQLDKKEIEWYFEKKKPFLKKRTISNDLSGFKSELISILEDVLHTYGPMSDSGIKMSAYRTKPMQYVLEKEKKSTKMMHRAVIYKNKTIIEIDK